MMFSKDVRRQIRNVSITVLILSALMLLVFALVGQLNAAAMLGALVGALSAILIFVILAFNVQMSLSHSKRGAQATMISGYMIRLLITGAIVLWGIYSPYLNMWAVIVPFLFPRIAVLITNIRGKKEGESD